MFLKVSFKVSKVFLHQKATCFLCHFQCKYAVHAWLLLHTEALSLLCRFFPILYTIDFSLTDFFQLRFVFPYGVWRWYALLHHLLRCLIHVSSDSIDGPTWWYFQHGCYRRNGYVFDRRILWHGVICECSQFLTEVLECALICLCVIYDGSVQVA